MNPSGFAQRHHPGLGLKLLGLGLAACSPNTPVIQVSPSPDAGPSIETDNPTVPVGFDAYRMWDHWPYLRLATRAYMRSTYDRTGGNEAADASHFLRLTKTTATALDVAGPGVLYFVRTNHWHGSPWHYVADGDDTVVQETNTAHPDQPTPNSAFIPEEPFAPPLAWTFSTTQGADLVAVPMAFTESLSLGYERSNYGTGYFIYDLFPAGAQNLSQPIVSWHPSSPPSDVVDLIDQAGQDIAPASTDIQTLNGTLALPASGAVTVFDADGPAMVRAIKFTVATADAASLGATTLQITWDHRAAPSIDAPVALFFGTGTLYNRNSAEYLVKAFPVNVRFDASAVTFAVYFPMPFFASAHVSLVSNGGSPIASIAWEARTQPYTDPTNWVGYLHATYVDQGAPTPGHDLVLLDTTQVEGGGDWCGNFVGTSFTFSDQAVLCTLEGDPRFFFDDSETPQVQGTGTEEWGGGGDYWAGGQAMTLPFFGHPVGAPAPSGCTPGGAAENAEDAVESAYRFLLADLMPFGKNARIQLEHGGLDESVEHYRTLAYWYGLPGACLVQTDAFHVGDPSDEQAHRYASPDASSVDTLTTRYEWGVDHVFTAADVLTAQEAYPATTDTGRHTMGTSEFTLAIQPKNFGVLLRRKLDYAFPDQRAEVYVADGSVDGAPFAFAGSWYLAGANACVYSDPPGELDPFMPSVEASNRRWRDDEFLVGRALTEGKSSLRVRVVFSSTQVPLTPESLLLPGAWSEFRYTAYVWTLPPLP